MKIAKVERRDGWRVKQNRSDHSINRVSYQLISHLRANRWAKVRVGTNLIYMLHPRTSCTLWSQLSVVSEHKAPCPWHWGINTRTDCHLKTAAFSTLGKIMREQHLTRSHISHHVMRSHLGLEKLCHDRPTSLCSSASVSHLTWCLLWLGLWAQAGTDGHYISKQKEQASAVSIWTGRHTRNSPEYCCLFLQPGGGYTQGCLHMQANEGGGRGLDGCALRPPTPASASPLTLHGLSFTCAIGRRDL